VKRLYLLRHAQAVKVIGSSDELRPLTALGKQACKNVGDYLKNHQISPSLCLSSGAKRTQETSQLVIRQAKLNLVPQYHSSLYLATAGEMIKELSLIEEDHEQVLLVGHNPGIEQMVKVLCSTGHPAALATLSSGYKTATLACITLKCLNWSKISPGNGFLESVFVGGD
jgi:phosphohistidine phosphatase